MVTNADFEEEEDVEAERRDGNDDDEEVDDVPEAAEVVEAQHPDLDDLLDRVVEDEEGEDHLEGGQRVIPGGDVADLGHNSIQIFWHQF